MSNPRKDIMARLLEIAENVEGIATVSRNSIDFADMTLPAISLLEGDEEVDLVIDNPNRPPSRPQVVQMVPQLLIQAGGSAANVGERLNEIHAALIAAVMTDSALISLGGVKGGIHYRGMASDLAFGREAIGRFALRFVIKYVLEPTKLSAIP